MGVGQREENSLGRWEACTTLNRVVTLPSNGLSVSCQIQGLASEPATHSPSTDSFLHRLPKCVKLEAWGAAQAPDESCLLDHLWNRAVYKIGQRGFAIGLVLFYSHIRFARCTWQFGHDIWSQCWHKIILSTCCKKNSLNYLLQGLLK